MPRERATKPSQVKSSRRRHTACSVQWSKFAKMRVGGSMRMLTLLLLLARGASAQDCSSVPTDCESCCAENMIGDMKCNTCTEYLHCCPSPSPTASPSSAPDGGGGGYSGGNYGDNYSLEDVPAAEDKAVAPTPSPSPTARPSPSPSPRHGDDPEDESWSPERLLEALLAAVEDPVGAFPAECQPDTVAGAPPAPLDNAPGEIRAP